MVKKQNRSLSFEETLKELESIVSNLEVGNLSLNEALSEFEQGVKLAKQGEIQLQKAEQRIQILLSNSSDAELTDFSESNT